MQKTLLGLVLVAALCVVPGCRKCNDSCCKTEAEPVEQIETAYLSEEDLYTEAELMLAEEEMFADAQLEEQEAPRKL